MSSAARRSPAHWLAAASLGAWLGAATAAAPALGTPALGAPAGGEPVEEVTLANGMRFLLLPRPGMSTIAAGWVAKVGAVNEHPGITGLTHFLEHMLFKGTETIGARDLRRERALLDEQEKVAAELRRLLRSGEAAGSAAASGELERKLARLAEEQRALVSLGEFGRTYAQAGAKGLNALTIQDMTLYFVTLPADKLELWFWLESDRLLHPVLRDFYSERAVVAEERRQRIESTPTGPYDEQLKALFWQDHPYSWPTLGRPADLEMLGRADAESYFETFYGPGNLTAALVGNFDPAEVRALAELYFGRLPPRPAPPAVSAPAPPREAERRLRVQCDCRGQIQVLYPSVPFAHPDTAALEVLTGVLNGRTGRLYKSLVEGQRLAISAAALQSAMRWAGTFSLAAEAAEGVTLEALLSAWDAELARLVSEPIAERELTKVKNQIAADAFRQAKDPAALMMRLLMSDGFGDWQRWRSGPARASAVTAADVQRVAAEYLLPARRTVGLYERRPAAGKGS